MYSSYSRICVSVEHNKFVKFLSKIIWNQTTKKK
jgi:hypothetical protein